VVSALSGAALVAASLATRSGVYEGGVASAKDPRYTVTPQRERLAGGEPARADREVVRWRRTGLGLREVLAAFAFRQRIRSVRSPSRGSSSPITG
jgi:hypothetical protein